MKKLPLLIILILGLACLAFADRPSAEAEILRKKARYYFLEGVKKGAEGDNSAALEYFKKAYLVDSTYSEAANSYGTLRFWMNTDTLRSKVEKEKSLRMMKGFVEEYPADLTESLIYAFASESMDTVSDEALRIYKRLAEIYPNDERVLGKLAEVYTRRGDFDEAFNSLGKMEGKNGKNAQISLNKISVMLLKQDTVAALREASELVASNPRDPSFHILKGNLYELIGNNDSTLYYYRKAEEISPEDGGAKLAIANFYREAGDSVAYDDKIYEVLLAEDFEMEEKISILGEYLQTLLKEKSDTKRGDYLFNALLEQYPHEAVMLDLAGRYSAAKEQYDEAAQYISYAIDQDPHNIMFWEMLMRYQYLADKPEETMKTFRRAEESLDSTMFEQANGLKLMYASAAAADKKYDEAIGMYEGMIHKISPQLPITDSITSREPLASLTYDNLITLNNLYTALGDTYYQMKRLDLTFKVYDNAIFFIPDNPLTLNNYAYFLTESDGDLDKALDYSSKAISADPENPTFLDTYAWVLFKRKEYEKALEVQKKAIDNAIKNEDDIQAEYYHHLGDILFMNHQPAEALENWQKALKLEPENSLLKKKVAHKTFFFE